MPKGYSKITGLPVQSGRRHSEETKKKMSISKKGKRVSPATEFKKRQPPWNKGKKEVQNPYWLGKKRDEKTKKKISDTKLQSDKGKKEKHWNWKGGITKEDKLLRHSEEYKKWAETIYRMDNYICQLCGTKCRKENIIAHHINKFSEFLNQRFSASNGITLCRSCHAKIHKDEKKKNRKRLLITGIAGFVGHHVLEGVLKQTDWEVIGLDGLNYAGDLGRITDIKVFWLFPWRVKFVWHDLKAPISEEIHKRIKSVNYIWHLAAETHVDRSLEDSIPFVMSNVLGTANLLEYVKHCQPNVEKFVYFSTDEVMGPAPEGVYHKEGDVLNPSNPYSGSKEGGEAMSKAFAFSFGLPVIITRTMNVLGERQNQEKFIPKIVKAILNNEKVILHGTPEIGFSSRCWIHARNIGSALLFLMEKGEIIEKKYQQDKQRGIYHIVGEERDVLYLANRISEIIKGRKLNENELEYVNFHVLRPGHDFRYALSGEKLKSMGWHPPVSLEVSFNKMIYWMIKPENKRWLNL